MSDTTPFSCEYSAFVSFSLSTDASTDDADPPESLRPSAVFALFLASRFLNIAFRCVTSARTSSPKSFSSPDISSSSSSPAPADADAPRRRLSSCCAIRSALDPPTKSGCAVLTCASWHSTSELIMLSAGVSPSTRKSRVASSTLCASLGYLCRSMVLISVRAIRPSSSCTILAHLTHGSDILRIACFTSTSKESSGSRSTPFVPAAF